MVYRKPLEPGLLAWALIMISALSVAGLAAYYCYKSADTLPNLYPILKFSSNRQQGYATLVFMVVTIGGMLAGRGVWWLFMRNRS